MATQHQYHFKIILILLLLLILLVVFSNWEFAQCTFSPIKLCLALCPSSLMHV